MKQADISRSVFCISLRVCGLHIAYDMALRAKGQLIVKIWIPPTNLGRLAGGKNASFSLPQLLKLKL